MFRRGGLEGELERGEWGVTSCPSFTARQGFMDGGPDEGGQWLFSVVGGRRHIGRWTMCLIRHNLVRGPGQSGVSPRKWQLSHGLGGWITLDQISREQMTNIGD
jgi:hypothetical protein